MKEFKAGDKVYCPHFSTNILTLVQSAKSNNLLAFEQANKLIAITKCGKMWDAQGMVSDIVRATHENHELLEKLYGVEFEAPPVKPTSREIVQAMLDRGDEYVPCWVSIVTEEPSFENISRMIYYIEHGEITYFIDADEDEWEFATPFDPRTGKAITELPE